MKRSNLSADDQRALTTENPEKGISQVRVFVHSLKSGW